MSTALHAARHPAAIADLQARLQALGAQPRHAARVLRLWLAAQPQDSGKRRLEDFMPRALREALPALVSELRGLATLRSAHPAGDGAERLLVALSDGQTVESVLLPRGGLCVSSQVGCAVGCVFCMTGRDGLQRQLGSAEIVAQLALARTRRAVNKVVFMGMGEPAHNLDNVLQAIQLMGTAGGIGHKNLVLSTVGDVRVFERLHALLDQPGTVRPALALSLHSTKPALRERLLPQARRITPAELVARGEGWARASGYPIQYQWTLIDGVNDGDDEVDGIVQLLHGQYAVMNLIPYNRVDGLEWQRPNLARAQHLVRVLHQRGVLTKLRWSAGQDVDAGCGQLRAREAPTPPRPVRIPLVVADAARTPMALPGSAPGVH
jgi:23S rRNA (adenine2503-C2)-methyltransferase